MTDQGSRWFRDGDEMLVHRAMDGLTLIYHRPSGITHIADSPVPEILDALTTTPRTLRDVATQLARSYDLYDDPDGRGLERHLESLVALGLVRVTP